MKTQTNYFPRVSEHETIVELNKDKEAICRKCGTKYTLTRKEANSKNVDFDALPATRFMNQCENCFGESF